jgi:uncharacterized membrane protein
MSELWALFLGTRIGRWLAAIFAFIVTLGVTLWVVYIKGEHAQATKDQAKDSQSLADAAEQVVKATQARTEVENENAKLSVTPPQKVADAAPDTAAGKLRDDGWAE